MNVGETEEGVCKSVSVSVIVITFVRKTLTLPPGFVASSYWICLPLVLNL